MGPATVYHNGTRKNNYRMAGPDRNPTKWPIDASRSRNTLSRSLPQIKFSVFDDSFSPMLTIRDLKMTLGGRVLFEHASLQINGGDRGALVGPNGAGKSTLFSIVLGAKQPDLGIVQRDMWTTIGYLP